MKVRGPHGAGPPIGGPSQRPQGAPGRAERHGGTRVSVSRHARLLVDARGPEVPDELRIARLKNAIRDGAFSIDAERIADIMLREER